MPKLFETSPANMEMRWKSGISNRENPDKIIKQKGMEYIEDLERDTHLGSCLNTRIQNVVARGFKIIPHTTNVNGKNIVTAKDQEITDFVRYNLADIPTFESDIVAMLDCIGKGYSISEINWKRIRLGIYNGKIGIKDIRKKPARNFSFDFDDYARYTLYQVDPSRYKLDLNKFIHMIGGRDDENPYGESASSRASFWIWLKKNGAKFWAVYAERFGMPLNEVVVPNNISVGSPEHTKALELLSAMEKDSGILIPEGFKADLLEATRSGDAAYDSFIDRCNKEVSKIILGQTLSNEEGKKGQGSYALGAVHVGILNNYTLFDCIISAAAINGQLIKRLVDINYITDYYPVFSWLKFDLSMLIAISQNIDKLAERLKISSRFIYEAIGIPVPERGEEILSQQPAERRSPAGNGQDNKIIQNSDDESVIMFAEKDIEKRNKEFVAENRKIEEVYENILLEDYKDASESIAKLKKYDSKKIKTIIETSIQKGIKEVLILGFVQGKKHGMIETNQLKETFEETYDPFEDLMEEFYANNVITKDQFKLLNEEMRRKAFIIAGVESEAILDLIRDELAKTLEAGGDWNTLTGNINKIFVQAGVTPLKPWHLETVIRTNLQTLHSRGREEVYAGVDKKEFPYKRVLVVRDERTRESHAKLHNFTRPSNDPIWQILKTPFDFNCRCSIVLIPKSEKVTVSTQMPDLSNLGFIAKG